MADRRRQVQWEARFREAWELCENAGECDAADGEEYRRVYAEWVKAGRPAQVEAFILRTANITAETDDR